MITALLPGCFFVANLVIAIGEYVAHCRRWTSDKAITYRALGVSASFLLVWAGYRVSRDLPHQVVGWPNTLSLLCFLFVIGVILLPNRKLPKIR